MWVHIPTVSPLIIPLGTVISMASNEHPVWRSHGQEAKRGETGGQRIPWHGEAMGSLLLPCAPPLVPARERVPQRCNASGAAMDLDRAAPAWAQWAARGGWRCCL